MADDEGEDIALADLEDESKQEDEEKKPAAKPAPVPGPPPRTTALPKPPAPQVGMADLERQIADERAQRTRVAEDNQRLQRERDQAILFAQEAERRGISTFELYNENQITSVNEQLEGLASQYESAMGDGDFKTAAQVQLKIGKLGGQLAALERDKVTLAEQREVMTKQHQTPLRQQPQAQQPAQQQLPTDPVERAIFNRTPPTKAFLRKHPELIRSDGSLKRTAIDAHENALDAGYVVDTPGYFQHIESLIGGNGGAAEAPAEAPASRQRAPTMAAPVQRGGGPNVGSIEPGTFMVTPKMRRLAEEQGVPVKEWVENYVRLLKEGRITPIS